MNAGLIQAHGIDLTLCDVQRLIEYRLIHAEQDGLCAGILPLLEALLILRKL